MTQTVGIMDAYFNGVHIPCEKGSTLKPGGLKNNVVIAGKQVFKSQEFVAATASVTTVLQAGQSLLALISAAPGELQMIADTGQSWIIPDASLTNEPDVTGGDGGKVKLEYAGSPATELLS
jgi:hypothetical protein